MTPAPASKSKQPTAKPASQSIVVASDRLPRSKVWGETDKAVSWQGGLRRL